MKVAIAAAMVALFLVAGIVGHDPWKPDEAYTFGLVMHVLEHGDWLVPHLAGEPFLEKPPLYFWTAALFAKALSPVLPLHDGARVASLFYMAIGFGAIAATARRLFASGAVAALLAAGTLGMLLHTHEMITDTALFAGFALAMWGLSRALERPLTGGALLGTGIGIGFMAKGLLAPGIGGLAALLLLVDSRYRSQAYLRACAWALAVASPWLVAWPAVLYLGDRAAFDTWFWANNVGRFAGGVRLGASTEPFFYTTTLPWFTLPTGVLAAWTVWRAWKEPETDLRARVMAPLALALAMLAVLGSSATSRALYAFPLIAPLAVLGSVAAMRIPESIGMAATCAATVAGLTLVILAWLIYGADLAGFDLARPLVLARWFTPDYRFHWQPLAVAFAALVTAGWVALWIRPGTHWLPLWTAAIAAPWCVWMTLMLPWIDRAKSFRAPFEEVAAAVRAAPCVQSLGLGEPQRAMLHYFAGVTTERLETGSSDCPYVLVQSNPRGRLPKLSPDWRMVWQGGRPGERNERFELWQSLRGEIARVRPAGGSHALRKKRRA